MNWDYAAGFMDADGHIGFFHEYGSPRPNITASQTTREVLDQLCSLFGIGKVHQRASSNLFVWRATGTRMLPIVRELAPRLIVKQPQALRVIEFIECRTKAAHNRPFDQHCFDLVEANRWVGVNEFQR